jgi:hypothetical protein
MAASLLLRNRERQSLLSFVLLVSLFSCSSLLAVDARRHRQLSRYVESFLTMMEGVKGKREEDDGKHRLRCA